MMCKNCKHLGKPDFDKLYPYPCKKNKSLSLSGIGIEVVRDCDDFTQKQIIKEG